MPAWMFFTQTGGIQVKIKEYERFVCGTLAQCHADNLGSHCIGGSWRVLQQLNPAEFVMEPEMTFKLRYS